MHPPPVTPIESRQRTIAKYQPLLQENAAGRGRLLLDQSNILDMDQAMSEMLGVDRQAYAGHPLIRLFPLRNCLRVRLFSLMRSFDSGKPMVENLLTSQGEEIPTLWRFRILQRSEINCIRLAEVKLLKGRLSPWRSLLNALEQPGRHSELLRGGYKTLFRTGSTFPIWNCAEVEIQSNCDKDCEWCPRFKDRTGIRKDSTGRQVIRQMPDEQFYSIVDQLAALGYQGMFKKHRLSEAFLDKRYEMFTRYVKENSRMSQWEDTNGTVLARSPELCQRLDGMLDGLVIGIYDARTADELNEEIRIWKSRFKKTIVRFSVPRWDCIIRANTSVPVDENLLDPIYHEFPCQQPSHFLMIRYDGTVCMCCGDDKGELEIGNAFETPIRQLYWSPRRLAMARTLGRPGGRKKIGHPCATCLEGTVFPHLMKDA